MSKKGVQYIKQSVPSFLKDFKEKIGYQEGPDVETKREQLEIDGGSDSEDEKPQIVVLKKGDLTHEEVERLKSEGTFNCDNLESRDDEDDSPPADGKIRFKKPTKRSKDTEKEGDDLNISSKKKKSKETDSLAKKSSNEKLKKKNKSLLSFNEEEEEETG